MSNYIKQTPTFIRRNARYSDLSINFGLNPFTEDVTRVVDVEAVKRSVKNLVLTNRYERLLDPRIGGNVRAMLFEPMTALTSSILEDYITDTINNYEPRVSLQSVVATPDFDRNSYEVTITFRLDSVEQPVTLEITLERIR